MAAEHKAGLINGIETLLEARNYAAAKRFVEELLAIDPEDSACWDCAVRTYGGLGDVERAEDFAKRIVDKRPDYYRGYELLAYVGLAAQNYQPRGTNYLVWALLNQTRLNHVEKMSRESLRLWAANPWSIYYLSRVHFDRRDYQQALETADSGLAINPRHVPLLYVRGESLYMLKRTTDARETLTQLLEIDPNHVDANSLLGTIALELDDPFKAHAHISTAVARAPHRLALQDMYWETSRRLIAPIRWMLRTRESILRRQGLLVVGIAIALFLIGTKSRTLTIIGIGLVGLVTLVFIAPPALTATIDLVHAACSKDFRRSGRGQPLEALVVPMLICTFVLSLAVITEVPHWVVFAILTVEALILRIGFAVVRSINWFVIFASTLLTVCYVSSGIFWWLQRHDNFNGAAVTMAVAGFVALIIQNEHEKDTKPRA